MALTDPTTPPPIADSIANSLPLQLTASTRECAMPELIGLATALAKQDPDILQAIDADLDAPNDAVLLAG